MGELNGKRIAFLATIKTDVRNAGGGWVDQEVVVDDGLISSRA
jgi:protease I